MANVDDALKEFIVESHENLDQLDRDFVALESDPTAKDKIAGIFRCIHTVKGNSGFLGLAKLEKLAHAGETLLSALREGTLSLTPAIVTALLALVDRIRATLRLIEETGREGSANHDDIIRLLAEARTAAPAAPAAPAPMVAVLPSVAAPAPSPPRQDRTVPPSALVARDPAPPPAKPVGPPAEEGPSPVRDEVTPSVSDSNVRVDVGLLDKLMNLVGELVLSRNQILQFGARIEEAAGAAQRLNLITTELQEHVMKTRMQPIGNVWSKLPRVVRDLSITCGKQVRVEMIGKETDLDRTVLEAIKDPLTHIVRNAVDHGIETPEVRLSKGKTRTGTLKLRAYHEGGQVNIEISDDGAGVNAEAVRRKAIERNLVTFERAERMTDSEMIQYIFQPGFSTAEKVSNVSGRGVGMDVVKTNIERIGGTVDVRGSVGKGTTIHIKIPLTLAIVPALIVASGVERYAIPQGSLLELVRLEGEQIDAAIERIHGTPVYRLRGKLLPIVFLHEQLHCARTPSQIDNPSISIVVLQADGRHFGLVVDDVHDTEEIVVKPLGKELKSTSVFAGATIMGDGRVALILDVLGLGQYAGAVRGTRESAQQRSAAEANGSLAGEQTDTLLLFNVGESREMAIPLSMVARLEEFPRGRVEQMGQRDVVQYRGQILPLIDLEEVICHRKSPREESIHVIVYNEAERSVGFVVARILDVVEQSIRVDKGSGQRGVVGAAIVAGKVTEILDVAGLVRSHEERIAQGRAA